MRKTESQKIALCGVLGALSVVLLLLGSALQIGTYAAPMLVSFLQIPVLEEYGGKYALLLYITVSILAVLLVPETELALFYALVMGYYPVLRKAMQRVKSTLLRWITKFAVFNAGTVLMYLVLFALLGPAFGDGQFLLLAVRPRTGKPDPVLPRGAAAQTEKEILLKKKFFQKRSHSYVVRGSRCLSDLSAGVVRRAAAKPRAGRRG